MHSRWIPILLAAALSVGLSAAGRDEERADRPGDTPSASAPQQADYGGITVSGHAMNDSAMTEKAFAQTREMGLRWVRVTLYWSVMEPSRGRYDREELDDFSRVLRQAARRGIDLSVTVTSSPDWARRPAGRAGGASARGYQTPLRPPLPEHMQAWAQFVQMLKARYPQVQTWSVWNEPNSVMSNAEYYDVFFAAANVLQNQAPRRNVAGPELAQGGSPQGLSAQQWFAEFARRLAYRTDVFTVHTYANEEDTRTVMNYYDSVIRRAGVDRPLWNTEANWGHPEPNDLAHASRMMRVWDMNREAIAAGKLWERTFGFHLYNEAYDDPPGRWHPTGWAWIRNWNRRNEQPRAIYHCTRWRFAGGPLPSGGCYERS